MKMTNRNRPFLPGGEPNDGPDSITRLWSWWPDERDSEAITFGFEQIEPEVIDIEVGTMPPYATLDEIRGLRDQLTRLIDDFEKCCGGS